VAKDTFLVIPDLQLPFEAERALDFCLYLKNHFEIPDENVLCVGDEVDNLHGGLYPKDPDALHTPHGEIKATRYKIADWAQAFPHMKIAISNHGMRWFKKAAACEIPSQMIRDYREVLGMPQEWLFKEKWIIDSVKNPFMMIHGMGYSGAMAHRTAALDAGMSLVHGHLHSHAGISHISTAGQRSWGMNVGCLIDVDSYAFKYGRDSRFKPCLGAGVIINGGATPIWLPYE
jgi:hypothetical protein